MPDKHLKPRQYYVDLYDRHTVERCRFTERICKEKDSPSAEDKKFNKNDIAHAKTVVMRLILHFEAGERFLNKEKTIKEWMDADEKRDELFETAQAPEGIRCLSCRNLLKPTFKELWSEHGKPDRVLFMYDCPNKCLPRRAFYSDGEEWRAKPDLCPRCDTKLEQKENNSAERLLVTYTCPKCGYTKDEEIKWSSQKDEPVDDNFAFDRDRFCLTDEEGEKYRDEKWNLEQMSKFAKEWEEKEKARAEKLEANPKGFHLDGAGYTCFVCGNTTPEGDNWYDEWGIKCLVCQKAIDEGEIPPHIAKDKECWYSTYELESRFNIKSPTWRKWVRDGVVKERAVSYYGNGVHAHIFLIDDNKDFLPPKKLTESQSFVETKDGKQWCHSEPWYKQADPRERLKGYKIIDFLKFLPDDSKK